MILKPQSGRRDQPKPLDIVRRHCRHLGGNHAAHRVADQIGARQPERLDHVERVQCDRQHVGQGVATLGIDRKSVV